MNLSSVSVIIPCHNQATTLHRAVRSAVAAGAAEVVIVNDASADNTISAAFDLKGFRVRLLNVPLPEGVRSGVCFARNYGIQRAQHPLILPLDADDELVPGAIEAYESAWQPGTFVYSGWYDSIDVGDDADGQIIYDHIRRDAPPILRLPEKSVAHATFLFHKDDWRRVGGYDPLFDVGAEDYAFMCALVESGTTAVRLDQALYRHYVSENGRGAACWSRRDHIRQLLGEQYPAVFHAHAENQVQSAAVAYP